MRCTVVKGWWPGLNAAVNKMLAADAILCGVGLPCIHSLPSVCHSRGHVIAAGRHCGLNSVGVPATAHAFVFLISCYLTAPASQEGGLEGLKLYGMVGVPGEEEADVDATIAMMQQLRKAAPKLRWACWAEADSCGWGRPALGSLDRFVNLPSAHRPAPGCSTSFA